MKQNEMKDKVRQRPLSRAYLSLCPFNKALNKNVEEEKSTAATYIIDSSKVKKTKAINLREKIR